MTRSVGCSRSTRNDTHNIFPTASSCDFSERALGGPLPARIDCSIAYGCWIKARLDCAYPRQLNSLSAGEKRLSGFTCQERVSIYIEEPGLLFTSRFPECVMRLTDLDTYESGI